MTEAATTPADAGSDSVRPSISLDDAAKIGFWEPGEATPEDEDKQQSQIETDEVDQGQETDEIDASGIDDDGTDGQETEEGDEASTPEPGDDVAITIGNEKISLAELKKGYFREADYTRQKQRVSHRERELETLSGRVNGAVHKIADFLAQQIPDAPSPALAISDPGRFVREKAMHEAAMQQLGEIFSSVEEVKGVQQSLTDEQHQAIVDRESDRLAAALPHLRKPGESEKFFNAVFETGRELGYSDAEMHEATDSRLFLLAHFARIGMAAEKAKQVARRKVQDVPPYSPQKRPQGANASRTRANQEAMQRLAKSGSIYDALKVDFD